MSDLSFAKVAGFGSLDYYKIYGFYEEPLMFLCVNAKGKKFLLSRIGEKTAKWLAVEISERRMNQLEKGRIEMREPFINPENGYTYIIGSEKEPYEVSLISPENITDDMFPFPDELLLK